MARRSLYTSEKEKQEDDIYGYKAGYSDGLNNQGMQENLISKSETYNSAYLRGYKKGTEQSKK